LSIVHYWTFPIVLVVWLSARHGASRVATDGSKRTVAALAALSVVGFLLWPGPGMIVTVFQIGLCMYCVVHGQLFAGDSVRRVGSPAPPR
jgi:hypothetical protein